MLVHSSLLQGELSAQGELGVSHSQISCLTSHISYLISHISYLTSHPYFLTLLKFKIILRCNLT